MKIVTAEQMKQIDRECVKMGISVSTLMDNAGKAVAEETRRYLGTLDVQYVLCLIGAGNNGGDGLVAARYLHDWGAKVSVYICAPRSTDDPVLRLAREHGIDCVEASQDKELKKYDELLASTTCVIDALLGTGRMRPLGGVFRNVLGKVNYAKQNHSLTVVAIDLPSGMDADTGAIDPACPSADLTVTLAFPKPGLFILPGAARVGKLKIVDIGIPTSLAEAIATELLDKDWAKIALPRRPLDANKGTFGKVMVVAGSINYIGAAYLACSGAMRVGAGLVMLATPQSLQPVLASKLTETTYLPLPESRPGIISSGAADVILDQIGGYQVILVGCGLGQSPGAIELVETLLGEKGLPPVVIDADALNIMSKIPDWQRKLRGDAVLTPHPGEMARLTGISIDKIQADRTGIVKKFALEWQKTIVLKGAFTVIASQDGRCRVSPFANPGMASAGTGDVLGGVIAGLAAQGLELLEAASLGVYLHGEAGEIVRGILGDAGMVASDLLSALPVVIKGLKEKDRG